jgi:hypothetical protein
MGISQATKVRRRQKPETGLEAGFRLDSKSELFSASAEPYQSTLGFVIVFERIGFETRPYARLGVVRPCPM